MAMLKHIIHDPEYLVRFVIRTKNIFPIPVEDKHGDLELFVSRAYFCTDSNFNYDSEDVKEKVVIYNVLKKASELSGRLLKIENTYTGLSIWIVFNSEERLFEYKKYLDKQLMQD